MLSTKICRLLNGNNIAGMKRTKNGMMSKVSAAISIAVLDATKKSKNIPQAVPLGRFIGDHTPQLAETIESE